MNVALDQILRAGAVAFCFPAAVYCSGWSALSVVRGLDRRERFAAAWGAGLALMAFGAFLAFASGARPGPVNLAVWVVVTVGSAALRTLRGPSPATAEGPSPPTGLYLVGFAHLLVIQALLPVYEGGTWFFDWWMHYDEARTFLRPESDLPVWLGRYTLASRTPLYNLALSALMSVAGDGFWVYQLGSSLAGFAVVPAACLVLDDLFGPRAGRLGAVLAPLNVWLMHITWFTWPKMLTTAYLLLGLHFYIRASRRRVECPAEASTPFRFFWVAIWLAFMTHQSAVCYAGPLVLLAVLDSARGRCAWPTWRAVVFCALTAAALVLPWYAWIARRYGAEAWVAATPTVAMNAKTRPVPTELPGIIATNLVRSTVPERLARTLGGENLERGFHGRRSRAVRVYEEIVAFYFNQIPGLLTVSLSLFLVADTLVHLRRTRIADIAGTGSGWRPTVAFGVGGALAGLSLHPQIQDYGVLHAAAYPTGVLLLIWAWGRLSLAPDRIARTVAAGAVAEFLLVFWAHVFFLYRVNPDLPRLPFDNLTLKRASHLMFLNDLCRGWWVPLVIGGMALQGGLYALALDAIGRAGRVPPRRDSPGVRGAMDTTHSN